MRRYLKLTLMLLLVLLSGCSTQMKQTPPQLESHTSISEALLKQHELWRGTPYRLGGDSMQGIDCSAFTQTTYRDLFLIHLPRTTEGQAYFGETVHPTKLRPGDLVLFETLGKKQRHVGIYVEEGVFLHASTSQGVTLSRLDNPYWQEHFWKAIRPSEIARLQKYK